MKKTLAALAVLGAFAGSALAADVTLYGLADLGLNYAHVDKAGAKTNTLSMKSGQAAGSRFGLKGSEDLGNGMTVGFVLENGFNADDGTLAQNRLFGRESQIYLNGDFGTFSMGRVGQLMSGNGTYGIFGDYSPFGTSWGAYSTSMNNFMTGYGRLDNAITYKSPNFAGVNVYAQYSFKMDDTVENNLDNIASEEGHSSADRYYAVGATYKVENLSVAAVLDSVNYGKASTNKLDDSLSFGLGGSYDFGVTKLYLAAQYFDHAQPQFLSDVREFDKTKDPNFVKGYGITFGADVPAFGGTAKAGLGYANAKADQTIAGADVPVADAHDYTLYGASVGYIYPISQRTAVYGVASYTQKTQDVQAKPDNKLKATEVAVGLRHSF